MVKWLTNVEMPISGTAKHYWKSQDKKVGFWAMQYLEVWNVLYTFYIENRIVTVKKTTVVYWYTDCMYA